MSAGATFVRAFGLSVTIYRLTNNHGLLDSPPSLPANVPPTDVTAFFWGETPLKLVTDKIPELPSVTDAPRTTGLSVQQLQGEDGPCWRLWFGDGTACCDYVFSTDLRTILVRWNADCDIEQVTQLFLDTVLAWTARFQGKLCLHASVPVLAIGAVAIVAPSGSGKSTLAAALASWHQGSILSDDTAVVTVHERGTAHGHVVHSGRPHVRLDDASLSAIAYGGFTTTRYDDKYYIPLDALPTTSHALRFEPDAHSLRALYFIRRDATVTRPVIMPCSLADAAGALAANLYPSQFPQRSDQKVEDHTAIVRLLGDVSCRSLIVPDTLTALSAVCTAVTRDVAAIVKPLSVHTTTHTAL